MRPQSFAALDVLTCVFRCNNVLYLRAAPQEEDEDAGMPQA